MIFKDNKSIYLQIADRICNEILQSVYQEEERIPSIREYAVMVEVNVNTVVHTFDYLQRQDIIYNKRGLGYFVKSGAKEHILELRKELFLQEELPAFFYQVKLLNISMDDIKERYDEYLSHKL